MGLGQIMQSAGALTRSESEFCLLKNEGSKRLRTESTLQKARMDETNARADEAENSTRKTADAFFDSKVSILAKEAAEIALSAAIIGGAASIASGFGGKNGSPLDGISAVISTAFSIAGAIIAYLGAIDEAELVSGKFDQLSEETKADQKGVSALDGNPTL